MTSPVIHRVTSLDLPVETWSWPFAEARRAEISAHFAEKQRDKPKMWNGRVLLGRNPVFAGERLSASYFETDFASFLAWRDWGFPDKDVFNGFGMGALRCADGAFVLGEMGQHTSNAGRIYFPSGTPDLDDISDGAVDISGSVARELEEETGLAAGRLPQRARTGTASSTRAGDGDDPDIACRYAGRCLARPDRGQSRPAASPELSAIHLVRGTRDLTAAMPRFVTAFIEAQFSAQT